MKKLYIPPESEIVKIRPLSPGFGHTESVTESEGGWTKESDDWEDEEDDY